MWLSGTHMRIIDPMSAHSGFHRAMHVLRHPRVDTRMRLLQDNIHTVSLPARLDGEDLSGSRHLSSEADGVWSRLLSKVASSPLSFWFP